MNTGLSIPESPELIATVNPISSMSQSELDLLRIILNGLEDLSFNQTRCTEEEKNRLHQVEQTITAHFRLLHREVQSLRAELADNQAQLRQLLSVLQPVEL